MLRRRALSATVALLSVGWLVPIGYGVETYLTFWQIEAWPLIAGQHPGNSLPFIDFARDCFKVGFLWLGLVLMFWAYLGCSEILKRRSVR